MTLVVGIIPVDSDFIITQNTEVLMTCLSNKISNHFQRTLSCVCLIVCFNQVRLIARNLAMLFVCLNFSVW